MKHHKEDAHLKEAEVTIEHIVYCILEREKENERKMQNAKRKRRVKTFKRILIILAQFTTIISSVLTINLYLLAQ